MKIDNPKISGADNDVERWERRDYPHTNSVKYRLHDATMRVEIDHWKNPSPEIFVIEIYNFHGLSVQWKPFNSFAEAEVKALACYELMRECKGMRHKIVSYDDPQGGTLDVGHCLVEIRDGNPVWCGSDDAVPILWRDRGTANKALKDIIANYKFSKNPNFRVEEVAP